MTTEEHVIWKGSPSQVLNLGLYLLCALLAAGVAALAVFAGPLALLALLVPLAMAVWGYLTLRCAGYEVTSERIRSFRGVLHRHTDELELYRVKDTSLEEPLFLRLFSLANLVLDTSDRSTPILRMRALAGAHELRERLRDAIEALRARKQVREIDFE